MTESNNNNIEPYKSRLARLESIIDSLSEFEQDEIRLKLMYLEARNHVRLVENWKSTLAVAFHIFPFFFIILSISVIIPSLIFQFHFIANFNLLLLFSLIALFSLISTVFAILGIMLTIPSLNILYAIKKARQFQVNHFEIPLDIDDSLHICQAVLYSKSDVIIESVDTVNNIIKARTKFSFRSPGELIGINIYPISPKSSKVSVYSKSLFPSIDLGKNYSNVILLTNLITQAANDKTYLNEN